MMRHISRHAHKTLCVRVRAHLDSLGWFDDPAPFGAVSVTLVEIEPQEHGHEIQSNTVAISFENEDAFKELELGLLTALPVDFYIDVYATDVSTAMALSSDIRDSLSNREFPLLDFSTNPDGDETGIQMHFEDVFIDKPPKARVDQRYWRVVQGSVDIEFQDDRVINP